MAIEVFDAIMDWDARNQLVREARLFEWAVWDSKQRTCGRCHWWMKSNDCPLEHNINGMSKGPSSGDRRASQCSKFNRTRRAVEVTENLEKKAEQLASALSKAHPTQGDE
ncbi:hypothetical protein ATL17_1614 [Maritalea mobilis]|uniref:Uncharacterized protein n=1 Tax=Maritalea mobilis TaxID=483324 RepID=A0A4R6VKK0_9HYPH|nr:hypothetical protein [Maritalea mobilis]TDQ63607.1 hypothetical protein ATL17_1614 [Maritalea mobilis]